MFQDGLSAYSFCLSYTDILLVILSHLFIYLLHLWIVTSPDMWIVANLDFGFFGRNQTSFTVLPLQPLPIFLSFFIKFKCTVLLVSNSSNSCSHFPLFVSCWTLCSLCNRKLSEWDMEVCFSKFSNIFTKYYSIIGWSLTSTHSKYCKSLCILQIKGLTCFSLSVSFFKTFWLCKSVA